tara:strand:- start:4288 stop:5547 length:1260 start_codon:yes stop_codon:yes gene_type:complete
MKPNIFSEISPLKNVIIHSPIGEHSLLKNINVQETLNGKDNPDFLLFDELVDSDELSKEHEKLKLLFDKFTNSNTLTFRDLLVKILNDQSIKYELLSKIIASETELFGNEFNISIEDFDVLNINEISDTLITGFHKQKRFFKNPLPNLIFTRDIGAFIGNTLLTTWSWHKSRQRESIITSQIVQKHPIFRDTKIFHFNKKFPNLSIEGGDINIFNHKIICIGISQRTSLDSIKAILPLIFKNNFKYVYAIDIPKKRQFMHLDCVFTKLDFNECLVYPPLFIDELIDYKIFKFDYKNNYHCYKSSEKNLKELFEDDGYTLNFLNCGGDKKQNQDSELIKMGANVFTLSPGVVAGYYRNKETLKVFKNNNYNIISIDTYLKMQGLNENEKYFIYLDENELSKGHGGIRCLTFPIERDIINE